MFGESLQHCWWEGFPLATAGSGRLWRARKAVGKQKQASWEELRGFSHGMELVSPTPSMNLPALYGVGSERRAHQLGGCQGKDADQAQQGWAAPPGAGLQSGGD